MTKNSINYYINKQGFITDVDYNGERFREPNLAKITSDYVDKVKMMIPDTKRINIQIRQGDL